MGSKKPDATVRHMIYTRHISEVFWWTFIDIKDLTFVSFACFLTRLCCSVVEKKSWKQHRKFGLFYEEFCRGSTVLVFLRRVLVVKLHTLILCWSSTGNLLMGLDYWVEGKMRWPAGLMTFYKKNLRRLLVVWCCQKQKSRSSRASRFGEHSPRCSLIFSLRCQGDASRSFAICNGLIASFPLFFTKSQHLLIQGFF